ncbi:MAG TPA: class I adenylate-forming enzyme family protein [Chthoniobacterales bacterium]
MTDPISERWREIWSEGTSLSPALLDEKGRGIASFAEIEAAAEQWSRQLKLTAGQVVALQIGNHPEWPAIFLALLRNQLVTLPLDASLRDQATQRILRAAGASLLLNLVNGEIALKALPNPPPIWNGPAPDLLKVTSGSTGNPRLVRFTAGQLLADADKICTTMGVESSDVNYGVIPFSHSYGFSNLITPLLGRGISLVVASDAIPRAVFNGLKETKATVFPGIPVFFQSLSKMQNTQLPETFRLCISAGAPLSPETVREFHMQFGHKIHSFYGASECGGICYDDSGELDLPPGFVGRPMQNVELTFLDDTGRIAISSDSVGSGYFPLDEPETLGGGVYHAGDLLEPALDGFRITGRLSQFINVAGKKLNPSDVEEVILQLPGVTQTVVFGVASERRVQSVIAAVACEKTLTDADIRAHCLRHLNPWQVPERVWLLPEIPVNERGKVSRFELATQFARDHS